MNPAIDAFLDYTARDRRDLFEAAAADLDTLPTYLEKDFWVCLVLDALYNKLPSAHPRLLFKGGTSLSKVFGAIRRFSEDIDIVVFPEDLGFTGERDPMADGLSKNKRGRLAETLKAAASEYICESLRTDLERALPSLKVEIDGDDPDHSTLLVPYPSLYQQAKGAYVHPRIKIEGGARSALVPHESRTIVPYVSSRLTGDYSVRGILTLGAERTFWEKVLILHRWHCGHRDQGRMPNDADRLSRHYYDVAMMTTTAIADTALADLTLLNRVREHYLAFFNRAWAKYRDAVPGSLRLLPQDRLRQALERDYSAMTGMILGVAPEFQRIMSQLETLQSRIDGLAA